MQTVDRATMARSARKPPSMLAGVIDGLRLHLKASDSDWRQILGEADLAPADLADADMLVPLEKGFRAFEAAAAFAGNPLLGVDYAYHFERGRAGALGFAVVHSRTVREMLQTTARFMPLLATLELSRYEQDARTGTIVWRYPRVAAPSRAQFVMWGTMAVLRNVRQAAGKAWRPVAVEFDFPAPADAKIYAPAFGPGLSFDRPLNKFAVGAAQLDCVLPEADPALFKLMTRLAEMERRSAGFSESKLEEDVRAHLATMLPDGKSKLSDLAAVMAMTPAQTRAELGRHGLVFKDLLDTVRREAAEIRLLETDLSVTDIAFSLGYTDGSIFTRACHKWFKKSPREVRAGRPAPGSPAAGRKVG